MNDWRTESSSVRVTALMTNPTSIRLIDIPIDLIIQALLPRSSRCQSLLACNDPCPCRVMTQLAAGQRRGQVVTVQTGYRTHPKRNQPPEQIPRAPSATRRNLQEHLLLQ